MPRANLRSCLVLLSVVATASSQILVPKPLPKEPLEKYDNPPPFAPAVAVSPALVSQFGPYTSYQVNVNANGNNIVGDAANEPSVCVDPTNGNKMTSAGDSLIAWRQTFGRRVSPIQPMAARRGLTPAFFNLTFFVVIRFSTLITPAVFFILVFSRIFLTTCGDRSTAANRGRISHQPMVAINSGLPSITPTAQDMDFSINSGAATEIITAVDNSAAQLMADSPG